MSLLNRLAETVRAKSRLDLHAETPSDSYDCHFCLGEVPSSLEASGVRLVPIVPSSNGRATFEAFLPPSLPQDAADAVWRYMPYGPFETYEDWLHWLEEKRLDPGTLVFAVYNTADSSKGELVGVCALLNSDRANLVTEIGHMRFLPKVQRTHIVSQTCWLLAQLAFEVYHVRRLQWFANSLNQASKKTAVRLGFKLEGELRWHRILPPNKREFGVIVPAESRLGKPEAGPGRHSTLFAIGWDDWEGAVWEHMRGLADRPPVRAN